MVASEMPAGRQPAFRAGSPVRLIRPDGRAISYERTEEGSGTLVLIHGGMCDQSFWHRQIEALQAAWSIVTVDLAAHGGSTGGLPVDGIAGLAGDVAAVIAEQQNGKVVLVGHSIGALVAIEAARQLGSDIAGLVVVDLLHEGKLAPPPRSAVDREGLRDGMRAGMFKHDTDVAQRERILDVMLGGPPMIVPQLLGAAAAYDVQAALRSLAGVPLTMIFGGMRMVDPEAIRAVQPDARLFEIPHAGHFVMLDDAPAFNALLANEVRLMTGTVRQL